MKTAALAAVCLLLLTFNSPLIAKPLTKPVEYRQGETLLEGYVVYPSPDVTAQSTPMNRPAVIVVHEWWGLNDYAKRRAQMLAGLGYVGFAADIYGKGIVATTPEEAGKLATGFKKDRALLRARINAAVETVKKLPGVDPDRVVCIGYCFGGTTALELARSGADVAGVVSFHGGLDTPTPQDAANIKARVLVLHGDADPMVPPAEVQAFHDEMRSAKVDFQFIAFGGVVHSFTNPDADALKFDGVKYDAKADHRSWEYLKAFLAEVFAKPSVRKTDAEPVGK